MNDVSINRWTSEGGTARRGKGQRPERGAERAAGRGHRDPTKTASTARDERHRESVTALHPAPDRVRRGGGRKASSRKAQAQGKKKEEKEKAEAHRETTRRLLPRCGVSHASGGPNRDFGFAEREEEGSQPTSGPSR